jgi:vitamin B12 transporter
LVNPLRTPSWVRERRSMPVSTSRRNRGAALPLFVGLATTACLTPAAAQSSLTLPLLVVSATGIPTLERNVASSVSVVTGAEIERDQRRTIGDVLATLPGVNVVQSGGVGTLTSVFIRGSNSNHVKVLIDGMDVSDPTSANRIFDFGHLQTFDIERVEVLRGPQSGLYGADAIGGVISITTKKGDGPAKVRGFVEGGSFETFNQAAGVSGSQDRFNYALNFSHLRSADTPVTPDRFVVPGRPAIGNFYDNATGSARLGYDVSPDLSFNYVARYTDALLRRSDLEFPPPLFNAVAPLRQAIGTTEQFHNRGELTWKLFDGRMINRFGAAYSNILNGNQQPGALRTETRGAREKFDARSDMTIAPGHVFVVGAEREDEHFRKTGLSRDNGNTGVFSELQSEFAKRIFLVLNARHDQNDQFGSAFTWRAAAAGLVPVTETKLKASYGTGFKAPSLSQLYEDFPPFFFANPNLRPERSKGYDAGFEQPLFSDRVRFGATYFRNDIDDLINCNTFCTTVINVEQARISGVETFVAATVTERVKLRAEYTYMDAQDLTTGLPLQRRPKHKYSVQGVFQPTDPLTVTATVVHVGSRLDVDRAFVDPAPISPPFTVVNLAANYAINPYFTAFGRIDNLFDKKYEDPNGFLRPGFAIYAGLRVNN